MHARTTGRLIRALGLAAAMLLIVGVTPAKAATTTGLYQEGLFQDTHIPDPTTGQASPPCVDYTDWESVGEFPQGAPVTTNQVTVTNTAAFVYDGPVTTVTRSDPGVVWREGPPGTYDKVLDPTCSSAGDVIKGFSAEISGEDADSRILCVKGANGNSSNDSYQRTGAQGTDIVLLFTNYTCTVSQLDSLRQVSSSQTDTLVNIRFDMELYVEGVHICSSPIAPASCSASGKVTFS